MPIYCNRCDLELPRVMYCLKCGNPECRLIGLSGLHLTYNKAVRVKKPTRKLARRR